MIFFYVSYVIRLSAIVCEGSSTFFYKSLLSLESQENRANTDTLICLINLLRASHKPPKKCDILKSHPLIDKKAYGNTRRQDRCERAWGKGRGKKMALSIYRIKAIPRPLPHALSPLIYQIFKIWFTIYILNILI